MNRGVVKLIPIKDMNEKEVCAKMTPNYLSGEKKSLRDSLFSYILENFCEIMRQKGEIDKTSFPIRSRTRTLKYEMEKNMDSKTDINCRRRH
jgi:hypothetical protein